MYRQKTLSCKIKEEGMAEEEERWEGKERKTKGGFQIDKKKYTKERKQKIKTMKKGEHF